MLAGPGQQAGRTVGRGEKKWCGSLLWGRGGGGIKFGKDRAGLKHRGYNVHNGHRSVVCVPFEPNTAASVPREGFLERGSLRPPGIRDHRPTRFFLLEGVQCKAASSRPRFALLVGRGRGRERASSSSSSSSSGSKNGCWRMAASVAGSDVAGFVHSFFRHQHV